VPGCRESVRQDGVNTPAEHGRRPPTPVDLVRSREDLFAARSALQVARRSGRRRPEELRAVAADLLDCLETYAAALTRRRLPVPRGVRDELRLRRLLAGRRDS